MSDSVVDPELDAMSKVFAALNKLEDEEAKKRILIWARDKFGIELTRPAVAHARPTPQEEIRSQSVSSHPELSINTIAARMNVKSCRELMAASAAYLVLVSGKDRFTREEWLETCRSSSDWKKDYIGQFPINTQRMIKSGQINENQKHMYSLSRTFSKELEDKIAER